VADRIGVAVFLSQLLDVVINSFASSRPAIRPSNVIQYLVEFLFCQRRPTNSSSVRDPVSGESRTEPSQNSLIVERLGETLPALFDRQRVAFIPTPALFLIPLIERVKRLAESFLFTPIAACYNPGLESFADIGRKLRQHGIKSLAGKVGRSIVTPPRSVTNHSQSP
jgi:hypothetical protein